MSHTVLDVVIVGAGQAGLSASYFLQQQGLKHLVFERGAIGETWRSQRWDSFLLNTANKLNLLPGDVYDGPDPDGFRSARSFAASLETYVHHFQLPVMEKAIVTGIEKTVGSDLFTISVFNNNQLHHFYSRQVIIASGEMNEKKLPAMAAAIPPSVQQIHAGDYQSSGQLRPGVVVVVGSAQSGCQIAEDLAMAGKQVFLATSMVPRLPRRYRGKDSMDWLLQMGFFDARKEDITDPAMLNLKAPQLTGTGGGKQTISLQALAKKGVHITGRLDRTDGQHLFFRPDAAFHVQFADGFSAQVQQMIDGFIAQQQIAAPAAEPDEANMPDVETACIAGITDLALEKVSTIIWATGFTGNFDYIRLPVFDKDKNLLHENGLSPVEGLYFLGLHWLRSRKSGLIHGISDDAAFVCARVHERHLEAVPLS
jgi:putative flavoprotein involved in K+ transport